MTTKEIQDYLKDNTHLSDQVINVIAPQILMKLNFDSIFYQIDCIAYQLTCDD